MSTASAEGFIQTPQPDGPEIAAKLVSLLSFTLLAVLFGIKTFNVQFRYLSYSRWLVLALYLLSWGFTVTSMVLVTTNNGNYLSCFLSIMVCDVFYAGTKIIIYAWLIEKVYVVSSTRETRWKTLSYRFHAALMLPYIGIFTLMLIFHTAELEASGMCIIGLQSVAALPLIIYDLLINLYMTVLFIRPLIKLGKKGNGKESRLHDVALRTLVASVVCLVVSFANIFSLHMFDGRERGLVCLACCTVDVTINVVTIHWVTTQQPGSRRTKESQLDYSTNQRESNGEHSSFQRHHHHSQFENDNNPIKEVIVSDNFSGTPIHQQKLYGYTTRDEYQTNQAQIAPYNNSNLTTATTVHRDQNITNFEKCDISVDSMFVTSSIHESQSSRKSLTKN